MTLLPAALLACLALAARAQTAQTSTAPAFTLAAYLQRAMDASPELAEAEASLRAAEDRWKGQTAAAVLPSVSVSGNAFPYGYNPANAYRFVRWRLSRDDISLNTTVDLNLFYSFQDYYRVSLARQDRVAAFFARDAARQDRAVEAARAYLELSLRQRLVEVAAENLRAQEDQYNLTQDLYQHGMKSLADLLKSETDWRSSQLRMAAADAEHKRALAAFNSLIDREPEAATRLEALPEPEAAPLKPLEEDLEQAVRRRPELLRLEAVEKTAELSRRQARRDLLPLLSVDATWNHQDTASFGQPLTTLTGIPSSNYQLGLQLSLPSRYNVVSQAFNWAAQSAAERQAAQAHRAELRVVRLEAVQARIALEEALTSAQIAAQKADLARRNLDLVNEQYRQGSADVIRLAQSQLDYLQARTERSEALRDAALSRLQYRRAIGERLWP